MSEEGESTGATQLHWVGPRVKLGCSGELERAMGMRQLGRAKAGQAGLRRAEIKDGREKNPFLFLFKFSNPILNAKFKSS